jgi:hypothetical protein
VKRKIVFEKKNNKSFLVLEEKRKSETFKTKKILTSSIK